MRTLDVFQRERGILAEIETGRICGRVTRIVGLTAEGGGLALPVGGQCRIISRDGARTAPAEVVGFRGERAILMPYGDLRGISVGDPVEYLGSFPVAPVGDGLIGRVLGAWGQPIDGHGPLEASERFPLYGVPVNPLERKRIDRSLATGVRGIDGLVTSGRGQRVGIFAGSGVGKSVLLGMIARGTDADVNVIALVGERGREVREFVERDLGSGGLRRSVVIVATSDEPALARIRSAHLATAVAESFRAEGKDVLLLMDSVTRVAMAQREVGLSVDEPPATRGYPPSVFGLLAKLLERAGCGPQGSITGFYTVLVEGDDIQDPVADTARSTLDGHIWLSRDLANRGFYPAVDPVESVSRVMSDVVSEDHLRAAREIRGDMARYRDVEDLIQLGAYAAGADPRTDRAIARMPAIESFLRQLPEETSGFDETRRGILELLDTEAKPMPPRPTLERQGGNS